MGGRQVKTIIDFLHYFALVIFVVYLIILYFENVLRTLWQKNVEKPSLIHFFQPIVGAARKSQLGY